MITSHIGEYCKGDISQIENYAEAVADKTRTWHLHHRDEYRVLPSGMVVRRSAEYLKETGRYYHCPPNELIFLTSEAHNKLHFTRVRSPRKGCRLTAETKQKLRDANLGKRYSPEVNKKKGFDVGHKFSAETRDKIRQKALGRGLSPETRAKVSEGLKRYFAQKKLEVVNG